jgi:hypothetical protein
MVAEREKTHTYKITINIFFTSIAFAVSAIYISIFWSTKEANSSWID